MDKAEYIYTARNIIELIELPTHPAYRGIADYIILLLQDLEVNPDIIDNIKVTFDSEFKKRDVTEYNKFLEENIHNG